jgi:hypothetical protein
MKGGLRSEQPDVVSVVGKSFPAHHFYKEKVTREKVKVNINTFTADTFSF